MTKITSLLAAAIAVGRLSFASAADAATSPRYGTRRRPPKRTHFDHGGMIVWGKRSIQ